jgi:hypothetical protein
MYSTGIGTVYVQYRYTYSASQNFSNKVHNKLLDPRIFEETDSAEC